MICPFKVPTGATYSHRPHPIETEGTGRGVQWHFSFPNGWGASVVRFYVDLSLHRQPDGTQTFPDIAPLSDKVAAGGIICGSHGIEDNKWELAVIGPDGKLNYDHPVSKGDVRGYLTEKDVSRLLARIAKTKEK